MTPGEHDPVANQLASALAILQAQLVPILEASTGYMNMCREAGFPDDVAAAMAAEMHSLLLSMVASKLGGPR